MHRFPVSDSDYSGVSCLMAIQLVTLEEDLAVVT